MWFLDSTPSAYDSPIGQITKLKQVAKIRAYQKQFETLVARTSGLSEEFYVQCFIISLEEAIIIKSPCFTQAHYPKPSGEPCYKKRQWRQSSKRSSTLMKVGSSELYGNQNKELPPIKRISAIEM